jgi:hypothetical protein
VRFVEIKDYNCEWKKARKIIRLFLLRLFRDARRKQSGARKPFMGQLLLYLTLAIAFMSAGRAIKILSCPLIVLLHALDPPLFTLENIARRWRPFIVQFEHDAARRPQPRARLSRHAPVKILPVRPSVQRACAARNRAPRPPMCLMRAVGM